MLDPYLYKMVCIAFLAEYVMDKWGDFSDRNHQI